MRNEKGFSLVELMVTMAVFVFVLVAATQIFTALLTQFKQQSKIGETDIEGAVGLNMLRYDLAHAGYGLPWAIPGGGTLSTLTNYAEAASVTASPNPDPSTFNDGGSSTGPRAIVSGQAQGYNGSDYLVIKSAVAATNYAAGKWINLNSAGISPAAGWTPASQNVDVAPDGTTNNNVRVIVLTTDPARSLVLDGTNNWYTTYGATGGFQPADIRATDVIYGIDPDSNLRMPFNRTDYYIKRPADVPARCAPGTGVLYKATVNQVTADPTAAGKLSPLPILDCVAYMHVDYELVTNPGTTPTYAIADNISGLSAQAIRSQLQEIRVYIIAQEGQRDANYDFSAAGTGTVSCNSTATVRKDFTVNETFGDQTRALCLPGISAGDDLSSLICAAGETSPCQEYKHYRWKLYTLVVQPDNLR